ncbi:MAG: DUF2339 domain-containing protein, partial [Acidobacteriota bacterium]|nr:DUF2339 domain-containing protein [Acidobacteriota bacterium]
AALDSAFLWIAAQRGWRKLDWLAFAGTAVMCVSVNGPPNRAALTAFTPVFYLLFAVSSGKRLFIAVHCFLLLNSASLWTSSRSESAFGYGLPLMGLSAGGIAVMRWRNWPQLTSMVVSAAGAAWFFWHGGSAPEMSGLVLPTWLFAIFFAWLAFRAACIQGEMPAGELAAFPINAALYFWAVYWLIPKSAHSAAAGLALGLAALHFGLSYLIRTKAEPNSAEQMNAGIAIVFLTLAIPIQLSGFGITILWAMEGAALMWVATERRAFRFQVLALGILGCAAVRLQAADLRMSSVHSPLINQRLFTAAVCVFAFWAAAWWSRQTEKLSLPLAMAGHYFLLFALSLEILDWHSGFSSLESASLSILFAVYAVLLVALGTRTHTTANRLLGLALIAAVVLKLYTYDVWQLELAYRFIAFAALGALLLTMSFFYSRRRESIATWLKKDDATSPGASAVRPPPPPE